MTEYALSMTCIFLLTGGASSLRRIHLVRRIKPEKYWNMKNQSGNIRLWNKQITESLMHGRIIKGYGFPKARLSIRYKQPARSIPHRRPNQR